MTTLGFLSRRSPVITVALLLVPLTASAQSAPTQSSGGGQGPMIVERVKSGFLVEPEVKVTKFDGRTSELVGADAGWLADQTFFIGGGGYWMANQSHDRQLGYGGLVLGLSTPVDSPFSLGVKTLLGGGRATVLRAVTVFDPFDGGDVRIQTPGPPNVRVPIPIVTNVRFREDFVVLEPQVSIGFKMSKRIRLTAGAGYRWMGRRRGGLDDLSGASGSLGVQIVPGG